MKPLLIPTALIATPVASSEPADMLTGGAHYTWGFGPSSTSGLGYSSYVGSLVQKGKHGVRLGSSLTPTATVKSASGCWPPTATSLGIVRSALSRAAMPDCPPT